MSGEPLPGLRLIASYAYTDAEVTEDPTSGFEGRQLTGIPKHSGSLWAVYEIQDGALEGLGFGTGVFVTGERAGDLENPYTVPAYALTNALLYYRRENWRVQLNVENLFDVEYIADPVGSVVVPGAPFTIRGQVSVTF